MAAMVFASIIAVSSSLPSASDLANVDRLNNGVLFRPLRRIEAATTHCMAVFYFVLDFDSLKETLPNETYFNETIPNAVRQLISLLNRVAIEHKRHAWSVLRDIRDALPDMSAKTRQKRALCGDLCAKCYFTPLFDLASLGDIAKLLDVIEDNARLQAVTNNQIQTGMHDLRILITSPALAYKTGEISYIREGQKIHIGLKFQLTDFKTPLNLCEVHTFPYKLSGNQNNEVVIRGLPI